jgi:hypothetical protein
MTYAMMLISSHLFLRLLIGLLLLSVAVSKLTHRQQFQQGILDYQIIPHRLEQRIMFSSLLAVGIPILELITGLGLLTGLFLIPTLVLATSLFTIFTYAILHNLVKGRTDLSCHCGGTLGDHRISWWLVGRNAFFIACTLFLFIPLDDPFTLSQFVHNSSASNAALWISVALPVSFLVLGVFIVVALISAARNVLRIS